jgi:hydroxymethylpyrimidine pyrophosphatase-like HAD family hydrolase
VLATDLDGTIAFDGRPPAAAIITLVQRFAAVGDVRVAVATSRAPHAVRGWLPGLADRIDLLCCNGALVLRNGRALARRTLPPALVAAAVGVLDAAGEPYCLEYGDQFLASAPDALPWMGDTYRHNRWPGEIPRWDGVLKLSVAHADPWAERLRAIGVGAANVFAHGTGDAEVVAAGVGKAAALTELFGRDVPVVAFGNDENDRQMLSVATRSVVVGALLPGLDTLPQVRRIEAADPVILGALSAELAIAEAPTPRRWWDEAVS